MQFATSQFACTAATWLQAEPRLIIKIIKYIHKYTSTQCWVSDKELIYTLLLLLLFLLDKKEKVAQGVEAVIQP